VSMAPVAITVILEGNSALPVRIAEGMRGTLA